jgi:hypothetical protein
LVTTDGDRPEELSFALARDRAALTDLRLKLATYCYEQSSEDPDRVTRRKVRERTVVISSVPVTRLANGRQVVEPTPVDGLEFSGSFQYEPPKGPWVFDWTLRRAAQAAQEPQPEESEPECEETDATGSGGGRNLSGFDWYAHRCFSKGQRRASRARNPKAAKRRLRARCRRAAGQRYPLP